MELLELLFSVGLVLLYLVIFYQLYKLCRFERFVALRYLGSRRKEVFISIITVISVLGVAVSVMVLNMTLAIMTGFEHEFRAKLVSSNPHIVVRRFGGEVEGWKDVVAAIRGVTDVLSIFPYSYNQAMLTTPSGSTGLLLRGVADLPEPKEKLAKLLEQGINVEELFRPAAVEVQRPDGKSDMVALPPIIVGRELVRSLKLFPGTVVTVLAPQFSSSPMGLIPRTRRFVVVGSYTAGLSEYESGLAYISLADAQEFFQMGERVTGLELSVREVMKAELVARDVVTKLGGTESPYYATDWTQPNKPLWNALELEKRVYFYVLLLLILVASFSIVSSLIMIVMEKSRDIALLKTMGATDSSIMRLFLFQGFIIGLVGTLLGTLLGYTGCLALRKYGFPIDPRVFSLDQVPVYIIPANFGLVAVSGLAITAIAGIYPSRRAARLHPAEALRFE